MSIDKSLSFKRRVGLKGGADAATASFTSSSGSSATGRTDPTGGFNLSGGQGPTFGGSQASQTSGRRGRESRQEFVDNLNRNNATRFEPSFTRRTYKPVTLDTVGARNQRPGIGGGIARLIGFALGIPGMSGLSSLGDKLGDFREKFTGYRTQEEYDNARQQRINLGRINTIQNTLNTKYADGDYSNTDLDERLAALRSQMGIVPNTPEQNAQQFLDFGNELAENTQQTIFPAPIQNTSMYSPDVSSSNLTSLIPLSGINSLRVPESNPINTQVTPSVQPEYLFAGNYSQNAVGNQLYDKDYDLLTPFEQEQIDKAIETYGTRSTGELA